MDIEGAFDNAPFEAMLNALKKRNIPETILNFIEGMLRGRIMLTQCNETSRKASAGRGCPQGGVLSPLLWNLVVDDLLTKCEQS